MRQDQSTDRPLPLLIRTKLHRPLLPQTAIERPRLCARLDESLENRITLISSGAGFGKTTLAAQWLVHRSLHHAWLSLDPLDNDPERFLRYFVAALQEVNPDSMQRTGDLLGGRMQPPWSYCMRFWYPNWRSRRSPWSSSVWCGSTCWSG